MPGVHYGIRAGDRVAMIDQHHEPGAAAHRERQPAAKSSTSTRRGRGAHRVRRRPASGERSSARISRACGSATRSTSTARRARPSPARSSSPAAGRRARSPPTSRRPAPAQGTDWYVNREDLGVEGHDTDRIERLAQNMSRSHAQTPSLAHPELPDPDYGPGFERTIAPSRSRLPGIARGLHRVALSQPPPERTR